MIDGEIPEPGGKGAGFVNTRIADGCSLGVVGRARMNFRPVALSGPYSSCATVSKRNPLVTRRFRSTLSLTLA
jgi:hypothetical protein